MRRSRIPLFYTIGDVLELPVLGLLVRPPRLGQLGRHFPLFVVDRLLARVAFLHPCLGERERVVINGGSKLMHLI